jgi:hypothetical protein
VDLEQLQRVAFPRPSTDEPGTAGSVGSHFGSVERRHFTPLPSRIATFLTALSKSIICGSTRIAIRDPGHTRASDQVSTAVLPGD